MNKVDWITRAKGIGIIFVVLGHVLRGLNNASLFEGEFFLLSDYAIYSFHMPLFFFLSGIFFLRSLDKRGLKQFVSNKFSVLFYLYLLWSVIQFTVQLSLNKYTNGETSVQDIFYVLFMPKGHMWFLFALLVIFIVNAIVFSIIPRSKYQFVAISLLIIGLVFRIVEFTEITIIYRIQKNILFFEIGIFYSMYFKDREVSTKYLRGLLILFLLVFITIIYFNFIRSLTDYDSQVFAALIGVSIICILSFLVESRFLSYLGNSSLEIYLAHILFASGSRIILDKFLHIDNLALHIFVGLAIGLAGPLFLVMLAQKVKLFNILFKNPFQT